MAAGRKRRRDRAVVDNAAEPVTVDAGTDEPTERQPSRWNWRTFPVFAAFVAGLLIASFINGRPNNGAAAAVQLAAIFGAGYVLIHLFVMNVIVAGRVRRREQARLRGQELAEDYEEEIVYPEAPSNR